MTNFCYCCALEPAAIVLAEHGVCARCAHDLVTEAAADLAAEQAERARVAERRSRPLAVADTIVGGVAGVMLGNRFVRGMRARQFRGADLAIAWLATRPSVAPLVIAPRGAFSCLGAFQF